ncbi:MAG TPA: hypothetical protein VIA98_08100 [Allosphingosinicella sp.]|jgi:hypothetical protein
MRDEMDARLWEAHGRQFSDDLHNGLLRVGAALARLWNAAIPASHSPPATRARAGQA